MDLIEALLRRAFYTHILSMEDVVGFLSLAVADTSSITYASDITFFHSLLPSCIVIPTLSRKVKALVDASVLASANAAESYTQDILNSLDRSAD